MMRMRMGMGGADAERVGVGQFWYTSRGDQGTALTNGFDGLRLKGAGRGGKRGSNLPEAGGNTPGREHQQ
jgi:hypothetical protein